MVATVSGNGLGIDLSSLGLLGQRGALGSSGVGRGNDQLYVNAANGNLVLRSIDERLVGRGADAISLRTYNSNAFIDGDNGDQWAIGYAIQRLEVPAAWGGQDTTVMRTTDDGSVLTYTWNGSAYATNDGSGSTEYVAIINGKYRVYRGDWNDNDAHLEFDLTSKRIMGMYDDAGNSLVFGYTDNKLSSITASNGDQTIFEYEGNLLKEVRNQLVDNANPSSLIVVDRVQYQYDTLNRLKQVRVDLTPEDEGFADGKVFITNYTYHADTKLLASIGDERSTLVTIEYDSLGVGAKVRSIKNALGQETRYDYAVDSRRTKVTDGNQSASFIEYDDKGQITRLIGPAVDGVSTVQEFFYDASGNVIRSVEGSLKSVGAGDISNPSAPDWSGDGVRTISPNATANGSANSLLIQSSTAFYPTRLATSASSPAEKTYRVTALVKANSGSGSFRLALNTTGGNESLSGDFTADSSWKTVTYVATVAGNATGALQGAIAKATNGSGIDLLLGEFKVEELGDSAQEMVYEYDVNNNQTKQRDGLGNTIMRVYSSDNLLMEETSYRIADPDGAGSALPSGAMTTRYVYGVNNNEQKSNDQLRFVVSAEGRVTEYRYDSFGKLAAELQYANQTYTKSGDLELNDLQQWADIADNELANIRYRGFTYDGRGQLSSEVSYSSITALGLVAANSDGTGKSEIKYVYDQRGQLLQSITKVDGQTESLRTFKYDGLGRLTLQTTGPNASNPNPATLLSTRIVFDDHRGIDKEIRSDGQQIFRVYDVANRLISVLVSDGALVLKETRYTNDAEGRMLMIGEHDANMSVIDPMFGKGVSIIKQSAPDATGAIELVVRTESGNLETWTMRGADLLSWSAIVEPAEFHASASDPSTSGPFQDQLLLKADTNGDGFQDWVVRRSTGAIELWIFNGSTVQSSSTIIQASDPGWSITHAGDFNNDGKQDLVLQHQDGRSKLFLMNGAAVSTETQLIGVASQWRVANVVDMNNDGAADIIWREQSSGSTALWLMINGAYAEGIQLTDMNTGWDLTHIGDFDGDGRKDLVWQHAALGTSLWLRTGASLALDSWTVKSLVDTPVWKLAEVVDLDADGKDDLVWRNGSASQDGTVEAWLMNGAVIKQTAVLNEAGSGWKLLDSTTSGGSKLIWGHQDGRVSVNSMNGLQVQTAQLIEGRGQVQYSPALPVRTFSVGGPQLAAGDQLLIEADTNDDGMKDFIVRRASGLIELLTMSGSAVVSTTQLVAAADSGWTVTQAGDFNNDKKQDLVLVNADGRSKLFLMDGGNVIAEKALIGSPTTWRVVDVADMDGDGTSDLLWRNQADGATSLWVISNGDLSVGVQLTLGNSGMTLAHVGDFNGDGKKDLIWQHATQGTIMWLRNDQAWGTSPYTSQNIHADPAWKVAQVADLDGDGRDDLIWRNGASDQDGAVEAWLMNGSTAKHGAQLNASGSGWRLLSAADLDFNPLSAANRTELIWAHRDGRVSVNQMRGLQVETASLMSGTGAVQLPATLQASAPAVQGGIALAAGDFQLLAADTNGDGIKDYVVKRSSGAIELWLMNGSGVASTTVIVSAEESGWTVTHAGDFNHDGNQDLVLVHDDGRSKLYLMNGNVVADLKQLIGTANTWRVTGVTDINGDGTDDLIWREQVAGATSLWIMNNGAVSVGVQLVYGGTGWTLTNVGDFNADGVKDLVWKHATAGTSIWTSTGQAWSASPWVANSVVQDPAWNVAAIADLNEDGKDDLVWRNGSSDQDGAVQAWLMNGATATQTVTLNAPGSGWRLLTASDLDSQSSQALRKPELIWQHTDGQVAVFRMNGLAATVQDLPAQKQPNVPLPATPVTALESPAFLVDVSLPYTELQRRTWTLFDAAGRMTGSVDANGSLVEYRYDSLGRLSQRIAFANRVDISSLVDANGRPTNPPVSVIRPASNDSDLKTWNVYDPAGRLVQEIKADGSVVQTVYDASSRAAKIIRYANKLDVSSWGSIAPKGQTTPAASQEDRISSNFYDKDGLLRMAVDGEGYAVEYKYDSAGKLLEEVKYSQKVSLPAEVEALLSQAESPPSLENPGAVPPLPVHVASVGPIFDLQLISRLSSVGSNIYSSFQAAKDAEASAGRAYTLSASLIGGQPLPSWLMFEPSTVALRGSVPPSADGSRIQIVVRAADQSGGNVFEYRFSLEVNRAEGSLLWLNAGTMQTYNFNLNGRTVTSEGLGAIVYDPLWAFAGSGDTDGDGVSEFLWRNTQSGQVKLSRLQGDGSLTSVQNTIIHSETNQDWKILGMADLNADSKADIVWRNETTGQVFVMLMDGNQITNSAQAYIEPNVSWKIVGIGDFDGDHKADLLYRNDQTGQNFILMMDGVLAKTGPSSGYTRTVEDQSWQVGAIGDFNGDGKSDILWRRNTTGENYIYLMNGLDIVSESYTRTVSDVSNWKIKAIGDFDGDSKSDIVWNHATTGQTWIYFMDGLAIKPTEGDVRWSHPGWILAGAVQLQGARYGVPTSGAASAGDAPSSTSSRALPIPLSGVAGSAQINFQTEVEAGGSLSSRIPSTRLPSQVAADPAAYVATADMLSGSWPSWLSFDAANGTLMGQPPESAVGGTLYVKLTYQSVSDSTSHSVVVAIAVAKPYAMPVPVQEAQSDQRTRFIYNAKGQQVGAVDAEGYLTETEYNLAGQVSKTIRYIDPVTATVSPTATLQAIRPQANQNKNQVTQFVYDAVGRLTQSTNAEGSITRYQYDAKGRLIGTVKGDSSDIDAASTRRQYFTRYDAFGRVVAELSAEGAALITSQSTTAQVDEIWRQHSVKHSYDGFGQRTSTTDQNGNRTLFFYDLDGNLIISIDALGYVKRSEFNGLGQLSRTTIYDKSLSSGALAGLNGGVLTSTITQQIDALANSTRDSTEEFKYHNTGLLKSKVDALGYISSRNYNAFGELSDWADPVSISRSVNSTQKYDKRGLKSVTILDAGDASHINAEKTNEYDAFGRLTRYLDSNSKEQTFSYDRLGRQILVNNREGTARYVYDAFGRVIEETHPNTKEKVKFEYDLLSRRVVMTQLDGDQVIATITTTKNRHGEVVLSIDGRGVATHSAYSYDGQLKASWIDNIASVTSTGEDEALSSAKNQYDAAGRLTDSFDARGVRTHYGYDDANRLVSKTVDPEGLNLQTIYWLDAKGQAFTVFNPRGVPTYYKFDKKGQLEAVTVTTLPDGDLITAYTYDAQGRVLTVKQPKGNITKYVYDNLGRREAEIVDADDESAAPPRAGMNLTTRYKYDKEGNVIEKIEPNAVATGGGFKTRFIYDDKNRLAFTIDALGYVSELKYDDRGRVIEKIRYANAYQIEDAASNPPLDVLRGSNPETLGPVKTTEQTVYNSLGQAAFRIDAAGGLSAFRYDRSGNLIEKREFVVALPAGQDLSLSALTSYISTEPAANIRRTQYVLDALGRTRFVIDGAGGLTESRYDKSGNVVESIGYAKALSDAQRSILAFSLSGAYEQDVLGPLGIIVGHSESVADVQMDQHVWRYFDAANRNTLVVDALGTVTESGYDQNGNLISTRRYASVLPMGVNKTGELTAKTSQVANQAEAIGARQIASHQDARTFYYYDWADRLTDTLVVTEGSQVANSSYVRLSGQVQSNVYDRNGNIVKVINRLNPIVGQFAQGNEWGEALNLILMSSKVGRVVRRVFDSANRLSHEVDPRGAVTKHEYDASGNLKKRTQYATLLAGGNGGPYDTSAYTDIQIMSVSSSPADRIDSWEYDSVGRMTVSIDSLNYKERYTYDTLGNRVTFENKKGAVWTYAYDGVGRLLKEISPAVSVTTVSEEAAPGGGTRKVASTSLNSLITTYAYDAVGNLKERIEADSQVFTLTAPDAATIEAAKRQVLKVAAQNEVIRAHWRQEVIDARLQQDPEITDFAFKFRQAGWYVDPPSDAALLNESFETTLSGNPPGATKAFAGGTFHFGAEISGDDQQIVFIDATGSAYSFKKSDGVQWLLTNVDAIRLLIHAEFWATFHAQIWATDLSDVSLLSCG